MVLLLLQPSRWSCIMLLFCQRGRLQSHRIMHPVCALEFSWCISFGQSHFQYLQKSRLLKNMAPPINKKYLSDINSSEPAHKAHSQNPKKARSVSPVRPSVNTIDGFGSPIFVCRTKADNPMICWQCPAVLDHLAILLLLPSSSVPTVYSTCFF